MSKENVVVKPDHVPRRICQIWHARDGGAIEVWDKLGRRHYLNRAAAALWTEIDGVRSVSELVRRARDRHPGAADDTLRGAVIALLGSLARIEAVTLDKTSLWLAEDAAPGGAAAGVASGEVRR